MTVPVPKPPSKPPPNRTTSRERTLARIWYWLWKIIVTLILGIIYCAVISEGLRFLVPALGQRIWKLPVPLFAYLRDFEVTHRLDLAHFLALFLLVAVFYLWDQILLLALGHEKTFAEPGWHPERHKRIVVILGVVILGADSALFYASMTQIGWQGTAFSVSALLATAAYLAIIVFVSYVSVRLEKPLLDRPVYRPIDQPFHPQSPSPQTPE